MRRAVFFIVLLAMLATTTACTQNDSARHVPEFLADASGQARADVVVAGVFVEAPVTSDSGTMFSIAEAVDSDERIDVYLHETTPLEAQWGSQVLAGDDLIGHLVIVWGDYDGEVVVAQNIMIQEGGGYQD